MYYLFKILTNLARHDKQQGNKEGQPLPVKDLDSAYHVYGIDVPSPGIGKDGDEDVLLDAERPGIQRELKWGTLEEDAIGDGGSHEVSQRQHSDLGRCGSDGDGLLSVAEKLVQEGEQDAGQTAQDPHTEGQDRLVWVVSDRHRQRHLLDRGVLRLRRGRGCLTSAIIPPRLIFFNCTYIIN